MSEEKKEAMSAEEFRQLAKEVYPHILTILEAEKAHGLTRGAMINIDVDGWIRFNVTDDNNSWSFYKLSDSAEVKIEHDYTEVLDEE